MYEKIQFNYVFTNDDGNDAKEVVIQRGSDSGLTADECCEAFIELMTAAGFAEQNIWDYFKV